MNLYAVIAIYMLFWWCCLFLVLPFRLRSSMEPEAHVPGQADSATPRFSVSRTVIWTTVVSTIAFALFYANYVEGWVSVDVFDLTLWFKH